MFKAFFERVRHNRILAGPSRQCMGRMMSTPITAAVLYDLVNCPHRVTMDAFGDHAERDPINAFVELLWKRGSAFEDEVIADLTGKLPFVTQCPRRVIAHAMSALPRWSQPVDATPGGQLAINSDDGLPNARPIALSDSPRCQRSHNSVFSAAVKPRRNPCHIAKHSIFSV